VEITPRLPELGDDGGGWSSSRSGRLTSGTHYRENRVGPRAVLDAWIRSPQIFQKSSSHLQTLGSIKVTTWSKSRSDDPRYWSDLWTSLLFTWRFSLCTL